MKRTLSLAALLVCAAARCETATPDACRAAPVGNVIAFIEGQPPRVEMRATAERIAVKEASVAYVYELVAADGSRHRLNFRSSDRIPGISEGAAYDFRIEYIGGFPPASAITIRDAQGLVFLGATDQKPREHVLKDGIDSFEIATIDAGCSSRPHDRCFDGIFNQKLRIARGGQSAELMHGESAVVAGYRVRVLTAQRVNYNNKCADAGLDGLSFTISREK